MRNITVAQRDEIVARIVLVATIIAVVTIISNVVKWRAAAKSNDTQSQKISLSAADIDEWKYTKNPNDPTLPGCYGLQLWHVYDYNRIQFFADENHVLIKVCAEDANQHWIKQNDSSWHIWVQRYKQARITGKKQNNLTTLHSSISSK